MKKQLIVIAALAACGVGAVQAQQSAWMVRARAVHLDMANKDETKLSATGLTVNNKTIPEIDISYFFNQNVAAELVLTVPQEQKVYLGGNPIGTFKHLPPTLTLQYHFTDLGAYKPYVGAGLNYTAITKDSLTSTASLSGSSWGPAFQVGVDFPIDKNWSINLDVKKVYIKSNVYLGGADQGYLKLNPTLVGAGLGYRF